LDKVTFTFNLWRERSRNKRRRKISKYVAFEVY